MIEWNPIDVLTCLETEPAVNEERTSYQYSLNREGIALELGVFPYHNDVWLEVRQLDRSIVLIDLRMKGCREIRYIHDGMREKLHFLSFELGLEYPVNFPDGICLQIRPVIMISIGHPPSE